MITYTYKAMDSQGKISVGNLEASHLLDLEARLRNQKLDLIHGKRKRASLLSLGKSKPTRKDLINFCFYLEQQSQIVLLQTSK